MKDTVFFAYPIAKQEIAETIRSAIGLYNSANSSTLLEGWEVNDISGVPVTKPIYERILESPYVAADITYLNENVAFEIGYAIGKRKRCLLFRHGAYEGDEEIASEVGIFDTLGYEVYNDARELSEKILSREDFAPVRITPEVNHRAPIYIVEPVQIMESHRTLISSVKKSRLQYRSFEASESIRLSAMEAVQNVSNSAGVIVPLMEDDVRGQRQHNLRAMFVSGLSSALEIPTLIIHTNEYRPPMDVRDITKKFEGVNGIKKIVRKFIESQVRDYMQDDSNVVVYDGGVLSDLRVGDPVAENEMATLSSYYLTTDNYQRAVRGDVNLIVGRKGSGKTALFVNLRNHKRKNRKNVVIDLKPEGYQLIKLKETVFDYLNEGARQHLITAFWEYLLLLEIAYKVLEKDEPFYMHDHRLTEMYRNLHGVYGTSQLSKQGDFSERLTQLSNRLSDNFNHLSRGLERVTVTDENLTEILYKHDIKKLFDALCSYLNYKDEVWLLFDNIDKGWNVRGVSDTDTFVLRCLIDASRKLEREFKKRAIDCSSIIFVRGDIYNLLMEGSADYGKEMRAVLDWSDKDLLAKVLKKRILHSMKGKADVHFNEIWDKIAVSHCHGVPTLDYMLKQSLMRPRNLLRIFQHSLSRAFNMAHGKIEVEDVDDGLRTYSQDLIIEVDRELTDVCPKARKLIYNFVDEDKNYSQEDMLIFFQLCNFTSEEAEEIKFFLLYYGILGIQKEDDEPVFIYDVDYDIELLKARLNKWGSAIKYVLNSALWPALHIKN